MSRCDPALIACAERCAEFGEPPCYDVVGYRRWTPCAECLSETGVEPVEPPDPAAVVRPLL